MGGKSSKSKGAGGNVKITEIPIEEEMPDLKNDVFNDKIFEIRMARDAIKRKIVDRSPDDGKS